MTVCEVIERELGQPVTEDTLLEDLPMDSLEFIDVLLAISNETGKSVPDEKVSSLMTVGDIVRESV